MLIRSISKKTLHPILRSHGWGYLAPCEVTEGGFRYATRHLLVLMGYHQYLPIDREVGNHLGIRKPGDRDSNLDSTHFDEWVRFRFTAYKLTRVARRIRLLHVWKHMASGHTTKLARTSPSKERAKGTTSSWRFSATHRKMKNLVSRSISPGEHRGHRSMMTASPLLRLPPLSRTSVCGGLTKAPQEHRVWPRWLLMVA